MCKLGPRALCVGLIHDFYLAIQVKEKYQIYKERLEQALALAEGNAPNEKSAVEQKPSTENSFMEEKAHNKPIVEQEPLGDESTC